MRAVIQRVERAGVTVGDIKKAEIGQGLLVFLGIEESDTEKDKDWLAGKISRLRVFNDKSGIMNLSLGDVKGEIMVISQFTLFASTRKGNRPSWIKAARPETAQLLYEKFVKRLQQETNTGIKTGEFRAMMKISLVNDGPVTIIIDSKNRE